MMEHITKGLIRKITIGDLKTGMSYVVGQPVMGGNATITGIIEDEAYFSKFKILRYNVYIRKNNGFDYLWKDFKHQPIAVEYNVNYDNLEK